LPAKRNQPESSRKAALSRNRALSQLGSGGLALHLAPHVAAVRVAPVAIVALLVLVLDAVSAARPEQALGAAAAVRVVVDAVITLLAEDRVDDAVPAARGDEAAGRA